MYLEPVREMADLVASPQPPPRRRDFFPFRSPLGLINAARRAARPQPLRGGGAKNGIAHLIFANP